MKRPTVVRWLSAEPPRIEVRDDIVRRALRYMRDTTNSRADYEAAKAELERMGEQ